MLRKVISAKRRQLKVRNNIKKRNRGGRSKICIFRSNKNIYVQLVDTSGKVLHSQSSLAMNLELTKMKGIDIAKEVGLSFAKVCIDMGINQVVFDKGPYVYGGRVRVLAESCREQGLKF